jgi:general secretion pathway protein F
MSAATSHEQRFRYQALDGAGTLVSGTRNGPSSEAIASALAREGLFPTKVLAEQQPWHLTGGMSSLDLSLGLGALGNLLGAGLSLGRAIDTLGSIAPKSWAASVTELRTGIRQGSTLATAMATSNLRLPEVVLALIRSGESAGNLHGGVSAAARYADQQHALRNALLSALAYPVLLLAVALMSTLVLVGVVIPRFAGVIADAGAELPRSTRLVLEGSQLMRAALAPAALMLIAVVGFLFWAYARPSLRLRIEAGLLRLPGIGAVRLQSASSRALAALAALIRGGTTLPNALTHAARAAGNAAVGAALLRSRDRIVRGSRAANALADEGAITDTAVRFVRVGEETGELARMLEEAAHVDAERATLTLKQLTRLLEPTLIVGFGGFVAFIAAALLQAVYAFRISA